MNVCEVVRSTRSQCMQSHLYSSDSRHNLQPVVGICADYTRTVGTRSASCWVTATAVHGWRHAQGCTNTRMLANHTNLCITELLDAWTLPAGAPGRGTDEKAALGPLAIGDKAKYLQQQQQQTVDSVHAKAKAVTAAALAIHTSSTQQTRASLCSIAYSPNARKHNCRPNSLKLTCVCLH